MNVLTKTDILRKNAEVRISAVNNQYYNHSTSIAVSAEKNVTVQFLTYDYSTWPYQVSSSVTQTYACDGNYAYITAPPGFSYHDYSLHTDKPNVIIRGDITGLSLSTYLYDLDLSDAPRLTTLDLAFTTFYSGFQSDVKGLTNVEYLDLSNTVCLWRLHEISMPKLEYLVIYGSDVTVINGFNAPKLEILDLEWCYSLFSFNGAGMPNLEFIWADGGGLTSFDGAALGKLQFAVLAWNGNLTNVILPDLSTLPPGGGLRFFDLSYTPLSESPGDYPEAWAHIIERLPLRQGPLEDGYLSVSSSAVSTLYGAQIAARNWILDIN